MARNDRMSFIARLILEAGFSENGLPSLENICGMSQLYTVFLSALLIFMSSSQVLQPPSETLFLS